MIEQPNRGKRSVGLDLTKADGREALMKLVETADVFLTNYLPHVRKKLRLDVDDLRARNPNIVVARGSGNGPKGPEAHKGGYDGATFWARGGVGNAMPERDGGWPPSQPTPAFGDVMGGLATAGAIAAALLKRERTGETSVVDVSLLATAMWQVSPMIIASKLFGFSKIPQGDRKQSPNPGVGTYRTADDRFISVILLQSDKFWDDFVKRLGVPDMATDPQVLRLHRPRPERPRVHRAPRRGLRRAARCRTGRRRSTPSTGVWSPFQTFDELYDDVQVIANGYLPSMEAGNGETVQLVASPAQFDEVAVEVDPGPRARRAHRARAHGARLRLGPDRRHEGVRRDPLGCSGIPEAPAHRASAAWRGRPRRRHRRGRGRRSW